MVSDRPFVIEKIRHEHGRDTFDCGVASLNEYLKRFARQNNDRGIGTTYVILRKDEARVLGYYTLMSGQVVPGLLPGKERKSLPAYPVPVVRIRRLAVDLASRGLGLGAMLLTDALLRTLSIADLLGVFAVEVDAIDETARAFYLRYGFTSLTDDARHLYLPVRTIRELFA